MHQPTNVVRNAEKVAFQLTPAPRLYTANSLYFFYIFSREGLTVLLLNTNNSEANKNDKKRPC